MATGPLADQQNSAYDRLCLLLLDGWMSGWVGDWEDESGWVTSGGNHQIPEPSTIVSLISVVALGLMAYLWRRRSPA